MKKIEKSTCPISSCLTGYIMVSYSTLKKLFGTADYGGDGKVFNEWYLKLDGETFGTLATDNSANEATEDADIDIDCWAVMFKSKDNPSHTIEVDLGYDDEGYRCDDVAYYAIVYDKDGNEVDEAVPVKIIND